MKKCPNGHNVSDDSSFCPTCGAKITNGEQTPNSKSNKKLVIGLVACLVALVFVLAFGAIWYYKNRNVNTILDNENTPKVSEKTIRERINFIFDDVYAGNYGDADSKWLTTEYNNLLKEENKVTPEDEAGYVDYDHWTQAQDCDVPSMTIMSVSIISDEKAEAKIKIKPLKKEDYTTDIKIILIHERGNWFIDDFISTYDGKEVSEKNGLIDYIAYMKRENRDNNTASETENQGPREVCIDMDSEITCESDMSETNLCLKQSGNGVHFSAETRIIWKNVIIPQGKRWRFKRVEGKVLEGPATGYPTITYGGKEYRTSDGNLGGIPDFISGTEMKLKIWVESFKPHQTLKLRCRIYFAEANDELAY